MIKAVVFDCFGVLYVDPSHRFYEQEVVGYDKLRPRLLELNRMSDYGYITQDEWKQQVAELTGLSLEYVRRSIQEIHVINQPLLDYAQELRKSYRLGMLSNIGSGAMDSFFSSTDRERLFDDVVLSSDVGLIKPHVEIFRTIAERLGVSTGECVMIDDSQENCAGADAAGMRAICYQTNQQVMSELQALLEEDKVYA